MLRRLEKRIYIPLPDVKGRKILFERTLKEIKLADDVNIDGLVNKSKGYSGADIKIICRDACMMPMRNAIKKFKPSEVQKIKNGNIHN